MNQGISRLSRFGAKRSQGALTAAGAGLVPASRREGGSLRRPQHTLQRWVPVGRCARVASFPDVQQPEFRPREPRRDAASEQPTPRGWHLSVG